MRLVRQYKKCIMHIIDARYVPARASSRIAPLHLNQELQFRSADWVTTHRWRYEWFWDLRRSGIPACSDRPPMRTVEKGLLPGRDKARFPIGLNCNTFCCRQMAEASSIARAKPIVFQRCQHSRRRALVRAIGREWRLPRHSKFQLYCSPSRTIRPAEGSGICELNQVALWSAAYSSAHLRDSTVL